MDRLLIGFLLFISSLAPASAFSQGPNAGAFLPRAPSVTHSEKQNVFGRAAFLPIGTPSARRQMDSTSLKMSEIPTAFEPNLIKLELPNALISEKPKFELQLPAYLDPASTQFEGSEFFDPESLTIDFPISSDPESIKLQLPTVFNPESLKLELPTYLDPSSIKLDELPKHFDSVKMELPSYLDPDVISTGLANTFDPTSIKLQLAAYLDPVSMKSELSTVVNPELLKLELPTYLDPSLIKLNELPKYFDNMKIELPSYLNPNVVATGLANAFDPASIKLDFPASFNLASMNMLEMSSTSLVPVALMITSMALSISMAGTTSVAIEEDYGVQKYDYVGARGGPSNSMSETLTTLTYVYPATETSARIPIATVRDSEEVEIVQSTLGVAQERDEPVRAAFVTVTKNVSDQASTPAQNKEGMNPMDQSSSILSTESVILKALTFVCNSLGDLVNEVKRWQTFTEERMVVNAKEMSSSSVSTPHKKTESIILKTIKLSQGGLRKLRRQLLKPRAV